MSREEWRRIAVAPDYEVSNLGRVKSFKGAEPRILRPGTNPLGYHNYTLYVDCRPLFTTAHTLVMAAFIGPRPSGLDIRHIDGNPGNNAVTNLKYGTRSENALDMRAHGTNVNLNKIACPANHPYNDANTYVWADGSRHCRTCRSEATLRYRARRMGAAA